MSLKNQFTCNIAGLYVFMLRALRGYHSLQVTMLLVVIHLLVKAADILTIDLT